MVNYSPLSKGTPDGKGLYLPYILSQVLIERVYNFNNHYAYDSFVNLIDH